MVEFPANIGIKDVKDNQYFYETKFGDIVDFNQKFRELHVVLAAMEEQLGRVRTYQDQIIKGEDYKPEVRFNYRNELRRYLNDLYRFIELFKELRGTGVWYELVGDPIMRTEYGIIKRLKGIRSVLSHDYHSLSFNRQRCNEPTCEKCINVDIDYSPNTFEVFICLDKIEPNIRNAGRGKNISDYFRYDSGASMNLYPISIDIRNSHDFIDKKMGNIKNRVQKSERYQNFYNQNEHMPSIISGKKKEFIGERSADCISLADRIQSVSSISIVNLSKLDVKCRENNCKLYLMKKEDTEIQIEGQHIVCPNCQECEIDSESIGV